MRLPGALAGTLGLVIVAGCLRLPPPRPVRLGELVELGAVTVRPPAEPGWRIQDVQVGQERLVTLVHEGAAGRTDRWAQISEQAESLDPVASRAGAKAGVNITARTTAGAGASTERRYGPLSARLDYRVECEPVRGRRQDWSCGDFSTWLFAAPRHLGKSYRFTVHEPDAPPVDPGGDPVAIRADRAEVLFDTVQLRPAGVVTAPTPPELAIRAGLGIALGGAAFRLRGVSLLGADSRAWGELDLLRPRSGTGLGFSLGARGVSGERGTVSAAVVSLSPSVLISLGRVQVRAGPELGFGAMEDRSTLGREQVYVAGGSLGFSVVLRHGEPLDWLLEGDASAGTQRFGAAAVRLGFRVH